MSVRMYTSDPSSYPTADSVEVRAVDHKHGESRYEDGKYVSGPTPCGHTAGWPDEKLKELPPECVAAGCRLGYSVELYRGRVLELRERNGYDDSDFFATIANEDGTTFEVEYGTTRGWTYFNGATIDASDELRAVVERQRSAARLQRRLELEKERADLDAITPNVGKLVRVKSKRSKIPYGTVGRVVWFGESAYGRPRYASRYAHPLRGLVDPNHKHPGRDLGAYRVGIDVDGQRLFAGANVFEILPEPADGDYEPERAPEPHYHEDEYGREERALQHRSDYDGCDR